MTVHTSIHQTSHEACRATPLSASTDSNLVWYAAYGSNMHSARLAHYLRGGRPVGGSRTYPGCRDRRLPSRAIPVMLPGELYFALVSSVWGGGMGFYDPEQTNEVPARAYLVSAEQFSDIAAQEMHRCPGADLDLAPVLASGRDRLGPGRYETLVCPGEIDGHPVLTFTAPWNLSAADLNAPTINYLANFASGLHEAHGWSIERSANYLAARPGVVGHWTAKSILDALQTADTHSAGAGATPTGS